MVQKWPIFEDYFFLRGESKFWLGYGLKDHKTDFCSEFERIKSSNIGEKWNLSASFAAVILKT